MFKKLVAGATLIFRVTTLKTSNLDFAEVFSLHKSTFSHIFNCLYNFWNPIREYYWSISTSNEMLLL